MKRERFFCALAAIVLLANVLSVSPAHAQDESFPDTSWFDPYDLQEEYYIYTASQLMGLAELTRTHFFGWNYGFATFEGIRIILENDIYITGEWSPIGFSESHPFAGEFDGRGHTIHDIRITDQSTEHIGTFGYVTGSINNLKVTGIIENNGNNTGGIAGSVAPGASISNCISEITVTGRACTGGIAGENISGNISSCINRGDVTGDMRIGGIVGENRGGTIAGCTNEGDITSKIKGIGTYGTGGIAGRSVSESAAVKQCHNKGNIHSENENTGGVAGYCNPSGVTITDCTNSGTVYGNKYYSFSGGILGTAGENGVIITNSYNIGSVKGKYSGGIIGNFISDSYGSISDYITSNYYSEASAPRAAGLDKGNKGKRNYTASMMAKSHSYLKSSRKFTRQHEIAKDKPAILEHINKFNNHYFIDLFSNGKKYKGDLKQNAAEHLQIIN